MNLLALMMCFLVLSVSQLCPDPELHGAAQPECVTETTRNVLVERAPSTCGGCTEVAFSLGSGDFTTSGHPTVGQVEISFFLSSSSQNTILKPAFPFSFRRFCPLVHLSVRSKFPAAHLNVQTPP